MGLPLRSVSDLQGSPQATALSRGFRLGTEHRLLLLPLEAPAVVVVARAPENWAAWRRRMLARFLRDRVPFRVSILRAGGPRR